MTNFWRTATTEQKLAQVDAGYLVYEGQAQKHHFKEIWMPMIKYLADSGYTARQTATRLGIPLCNIFAVAKRNGIVFKSVYRTDISESESLAEALRYDPETGRFFWKSDRGSNHLKGKPAGTIRNGYIAINFQGKFYLAHRLAWYFVNGRWPEKWIDHIDRDKANNRISNLRECDASGNNWNKQTPEREFPRGVSLDKRNGSFIARSKLNGKHKHIGSFATVEQAREAYIEFAQVVSNGFYQELSHDNA